MTNALEFHLLLSDFRITQPRIASGVTSMMFGSARLLKVHILAMLLLALPSIAYATTTTYAPTTNSGSVTAQSDDADGVDYDFEPFTLSGWGNIPINGPITIYVTSSDSDANAGYFGDDSGVDFVPGTLGADGVCYGSVANELGGISSQHTSETDSIGQLSLATLNSMGMTNLNQFCVVVYAVATWDSTFGWDNTENVTVTDIYVAMNSAVTPTITWTPPTAITYGTALSTAQLDATTGVVGTYSYSPALGTILTVGTHYLSVTFTPTDTTDYTTATSVVILTVNKATPTVTAWPMASSINYGQTLASSTLSGGTASVAGSFSFTTPSTAPGAGAASQSVTFTPSDTTDYNTVIGSVSVTVNKATPVITWPTPALITYSAPTSTTLPLWAGIITTLAGNGDPDSSGDNGLATSAGLEPLKVAVDAFGNIYFADYSSNTVRKIAASSGIITTIAGNGNYGSAGDGDLAINAQLSYPDGIAVDPTGNYIYIADYINARIRMVTVSTGIITTVAGGGTGEPGDGGLAINAELGFPTGVALDSSGNIYIADMAYGIRKVTKTTGIITTVAGGGTSGLGDGGPATSAEVISPSGVAVDVAGNIYIVDSYYSRIRKVTASTNIINTIAGNGTRGYSGDGGLATAAGVEVYAYDVAVDAAGNVYIADGGNNRIRVVSASTGIISTLAGNATQGYSGDDGPAAGAELAGPSGIAVDAAGNIYIADFLNSRIRAIGAPNMILGPAQLNATANVPGTFVYTPSAGTALTVGSQPLSTVFTPTDTLNYTTATASVTVTVNPGTPSLRFAPIPALTYGVSPFAVTAASDSTGAITYSVASGPATISNGTVTILGTGTVVLSASQVASANYTTATASVSFAVNPATPTLNFAVIPEQFYGASPFTVSATSASPGAVTYSLVSGPATISGSTVTVTGIGTVVLSASQAATANYTAPANATVSFAVSPATPLITWATPAPIPSGTALTGAQLNASASVPGTITYSPALGTVLAVGSQPLTATFTPTDTTDYNTAKATVYLTVNSATAISDFGTVTLTVNNVIAATTTYQAGSTPASIAEGLAIGVEASSPVYVAAVNDVVYLDAKPAYAGTDFSYSVQNTSYDSAHFSQPSFPAAPIIGSLNGGVSTGAGKLVYSFVGSYDGVGNLSSYTDNTSGGQPNGIMGTWSFNYDTLNRLIAGSPSSGSYAGQNLCWAYDAFGNRTAQSSQTAACPASLTPTVSYNANNQITGGFIQYDPAGSGNVIADSTTGNQYLYDGEGRICAVKSEPVGSTYTLTGYIYDADGTRVAKGSLTQFTCDLNPADSAYNGFQPTTDYILGPGGEQVTEMAMDSNNTMAWQHTNVYAGMLLATYDNTGLHFYFNDPLGTRRAQTDYAGVLEQTCASLPFGDGLSCTGSITAPTEHHFTGKERDTESGNDYFGARYYASSMGRFMSPDPSQLGYADSTNPQSLNLYSYVRNNPLINSDPSGLECVWDDGSYDSEDDPDTGNGDNDPQSHAAKPSGVGKCQKAGGTWIELGENGNWNPNKNDTLKQAVADIQSGFWSSIAVTNSNTGSTNYTFYTSGGRAVGTDTGGVLEGYSYFDKDDKDAIHSKSASDPDGLFGNWLFRTGRNQKPLDRNDQTFRTQQISNGIDYLIQHPLGRDLHQSACTGAGIWLAGSGAGAGPWVAGTAAWAMYGVTTGGGAALLFSDACN
jgi:RHS repeat-associated protein